MAKPSQKAIDLFDSMGNLIAQWNAALPEDRKQASKLMEQSGLAADAGPLGVLLTGLFRALASADPGPVSSKKGRPTYGKAKQRT